MQFGIPIGADLKPVFSDIALILLKVIHPTLPVTAAPLVEFHIRELHGQKLLNSWGLHTRRVLHCIKY